MPGLGSAYGAQAKGPTVGQVIPSETSSFDYLDKWFDDSGNVTGSSQDIRQDVVKSTMSDWDSWVQSQKSGMVTLYQKGPRTQRALSSAVKTLQSTIQEEFKRREQEVKRRVAEIGKDMQTRKGQFAKRAATREAADTIMQDVMPKAAKLLYGVPENYMAVKQQLLSENPDRLVQEYIKKRMPDTDDPVQQKNWVDLLVKANTTLEQQRKGAKKKEPKTDVMQLYDSITGKPTIKIDVARGKKPDVPEGMVRTKPKQEPDPTVDESRKMLIGLKTGLAKLEESGTVDESSGDTQLDAMIRKTPGLLFLTDKGKMSPEAIEEISALYRDRIAFYEEFLPKDELEGLPTETVGTRENAPETFTQTATDANGNKMGWNGTAWVSIPTQ